MPEIDEHIEALADTQQKVEAAELSSSINEIISNRPEKIVRKGTTVIILLIVLMLSATWFIKYPDTVNSNAILTAINAPKPVVPKMQGKLNMLLVTDGDTVETHTIIGVLETTASLNEILQMEQSLKAIESILMQGKFDTLKALVTVTPFANLGELQASWQTFVQAYLNFASYSGAGLYVEKLQLLQQDVVRLQKSKHILYQQKQLSKKDLNLTKTTHAANERLAEDKVISQQEYRELTSKLIGKQMSLPQLEASLVDNEAQINDKRKEILELENQMATQKALFRETLNTMKSQLAEWEQKYLLRAPATGRLHFTRIIQENQQVQAGIPLAFVTPSNTTYVMEATVPQNNFGKVKKGQKVLIKFPAYHWQEYGIVEGRIQHIAAVASDSNGYRAHISLPQGLKTDQGKQIAYREGLVADIEIITKNQRLLEKLYRSVLSINQP